MKDFTEKFFHLATLRQSDPQANLDLALEAIHQDATAELTLHTLANSGKKLILRDKID